MRDDLRDLERLVEAAERVVASLEQSDDARYDAAWDMREEGLVPAARACLERLKAKAEDGVSSGPVASYQREAVVPAPTTNPELTAANLVVPAPPAVDLEDFNGDILLLQQSGQRGFADKLERLLAEARAGRAAREALEVLAGVCRRLGDEDLLAVDVMVLLGMDAALAKAENALKGGAQ